MMILVIAVISITHVCTERHEDDNTRRLLESIRRQLTHDNHDYIDTTTTDGSIYITKQPVVLTDARRNMDVNNDKQNDKLKQKEDTANNVKIKEEAAQKKHDKDKDEDNVLKQVMLQESKPNQTRKYMVYNNKRGEVSLVKLGEEFPMFRLPRGRAQYRGGGVE